MKLSVILVTDHANYRTASLVTYLQKNAVMPCEVLCMLPPGRLAPPAVATSLPLHYVPWIDAEPYSLGGALNRLVWLASGEGLIFMDPNDDWPAEGITAYATRLPTEYGLIARPTTDNRLDLRTMAIRKSSYEFIGGLPEMPLTIAELSACFYERAQQQSVPVSWLPRSGFNALTAEKLPKNAYL